MKSFKTHGSLHLWLQDPQSIVLISLVKARLQEVWHYGRHKRTQQRSWKLHIFDGTEENLVLWIHLIARGSWGVDSTTWESRMDSGSKKLPFKTPFIISAWIRAVKGHRLKRFQTKGSLALFAHWVPACSCESTSPLKGLARLSVMLSQMCCGTNVLTKSQAFGGGPLSNTQIFFFSLFFFSFFFF